MPGPENARAFVLDLGSGDGRGGHQDTDRGTKEFEAICKQATDLHELNPDVWGACMFTVLKDLPDITEGHFTYQNVVRFLYSLFCACLNLALQIGLVCGVILFVTMPSVRTAQDAYHTFHKEAFENGTFSSERFDAMDDDTKESVCSLALSNVAFLRAVLFLWVSNCAGNLRTILKKMGMVHGLPTLPKGISTADMMIEEEDDSCKTVSLTAGFRFAVWLLVLIPEFLIFLCLSVFGCIWLTATESFSDLILNSLALGFVVEIDELIFEAYLPVTFQERLAKWTIAMPQVSDDLLDQATKEVREGQTFRRNYIVSAVMLTGVLCFIEIFLRFQPVLPYFENDLKDHCWEYRNEASNPECMPWMNDCFPTQ